MPDDRHAGGLDSHLPTEAEQGRLGVIGLAVEARRQEVTARLPDSSLVEAQRRNAPLCKCRCERGRNVQRLPGHVGVAIERPRPVEQQRRGSGTVHRRPHQRPDEVDAVVGREHDPLLHFA